MQATTAVAAIPVTPTIRARRERRLRAVTLWRVSPVGPVELVVLVELDLSAGVKNEGKRILSNGSTGVHSPRRRQGDVEPGGATPLQRSRRSWPCPGQDRAWLETARTGG
ncbi:hypothetical protein GCM10025867_23530 [Frondihabitans sucicola]|uniref:Uncharacterized protein n=1 Tax=Frondihabitans sucicola TaxID=1268041 RepID=A0ABN6XYJ8_9MICO|nr:hypothetical protein GCM10025867_23530 [Frondihabitans sucicola]